ncbi:MAG TPA: histidine kinase [Microvirga sp.]|jgi:hypothetical protein
MADYYPLIARAIDGLADSTPEARRGVYERARAALTEQLRTLDPPLSETDIRREQLSLDDAIERLEAERDPDAARPRLSDGVSLPGATPAPGPTDGSGQQAPPPAAPEPAEDAFDEYLPQTTVADYEEASGPSRPRVDSRSPVIRSAGRGRTLLLGSILALVIGVIAVAAWYLNTNDPRQLAAQQTPAPEAPAPRPTDGQKFGERVGGGPPLPQPANPASPAAPARTDVTVAQRAIFYEEDPANPQLPKAHPGRVVWRLEAVNAGQGRPLETAVRAVVEIADAGLTLNMLIRRNTDQALPASHTVELTFTTRAGEAGRAIRDVGLLQFKNEEAARGTPVAGLPVPVRENLFLIGLSNLQNDIDRNIELMVRRAWVDLPVRMASGQRAILSIEKGAAGEQVMNDAFRQWQ